MTPVVACQYTSGTIQFEIRLETYQSSHEVVQLQRPMDSAREEQCTMGDDHGQRQVARFPPRAQQHYRDDEQDRIDA